MIEAIWAYVLWFLQGVDKSFGLDHGALTGVKIGLVGASVGVVALWRDAPCIRGMPAKWLRWSRYLYCVAGLAVVSSYLAVGWARHLPIIAFFAAMLNMIVANKVTNNKP